MAWLLLLAEGFNHDDKEDINPKKHFIFYIYLYLCKQQKNRGLLILLCCIINDKAYQIMSNKIVIRPKRYCNYNTHVFFHFEEDTYSYMTYQNKNIANDHQIHQIPYRALKSKRERSRIKSENTEFAFLRELCL